MGDAVVQAYRDRARVALRRRGIPGLALVWIQALVDSVRNGPGERVRPAVGWRRNGNWGRDAEVAIRRLLRARTFAAVTTATLTVGLGMVAVAYTVVHRHEMAVRLALGADHGRVLRLVLGEGAVLAGSGVLIGIPGIYIAGRLMRGVLVGISPMDPLTLAVVAAGLGLVTLAACYVPARRVLGIEPAQSLRQE
jgi:predicted lysophospholipase L1 biosynthesis ABC-type transport system permease subunit